MSQARTRPPDCRAVDTVSRFERAMPWALRAVWILVVVAGGEALDAATAERSARVGDAATIGGGIAWIVGVAAMAIPSVVGLTATRLVVPLAAPVAVVAAIAGGGADAAIFLVVATLALVIAMSGEFGRAFVQSSAYGEEDRYLLRPPPAYALAAVVSWLIWGAATVATPLLIGVGNWLAIVTAAIAVALGIWSWPRWHRLARRWLVIVPVGVVVHDHLVLGETLMIRRQEIAAVGLALAGTDAADLTGPAGGHALEIRTSESVTAILAGTPRTPGGSAIHLTACLVAPTRPGRALSGAAGRRLSVGDR